MSCWLRDTSNRHNILGTNYGWDASEKQVEVLLDAQIDKLNVRHVRMSNERCMSGYAEHLEVAGEIGPINRRNRTSTTSAP